MLKKLHLLIALVLSMFAVAAPALADDEDLGDDPGTQQSDDQSDDPSADDESADDEDACAADDESDDPSSDEEDADSEDDPSADEESSSDDEDTSDEDTSDEDSSDEDTSDDDSSSEDDSSGDDSGDDEEVVVDDGDDLGADCEELAPGVVIHDVSGLTLRGVLRKGFIDGGTFDLPGAGSITRTVVAKRPRGGHRRHHYAGAARSRTVRVGRGTARIRHAGTVHVRIRINRTGRKLLRKRGVKLTIRTTVKLRAGKKLTFSKRLMLKRSTHR